MGGLLFDRDKRVLNPDSLQPVFLLMARAGIHADKGFTNVSPFLIKKAIDTVGGQVMNCKKLRNGQLLIECTNGKQANKIIKMMSLSIDIFVNVEEHKSLNVSKGIFYTNELRCLDDEEIKKEIVTLNKSITDIKRLKKRDPETKQLTTVDSGLYIVTFNVRDPPESVYVGYFYSKVKPYIPNPLRCYNCFKFGHVSDKCSTPSKVCPHCNQNEHTNVDESGKREKCNNKPKCANCSSDHNSFSKECPLYKKEYEIQTIRITEKITIYEARKQYAIRNPLPVSFANASSLKPTTPSATTKTCNCSCNCKTSGEQPKLTTNEISTPVKSLKETLSTVSSIREITRTDGSKINLIPKSISKRKKREIAKAEKKKKKSSGKEFDDINIDLNNFISTSNAHGGVCIYLNSSIEGEEILLNTELQVVAIKIKFPINCILCSIYLPGSESISKNELNNLTRQFDLPYILLGDFNGHNTIWGSERTDSRGKIIGQFVNENDLNILDNISCPTHFSHAYGSFSHIDLSIISPEISQYFEWNICNDIHGSDHYPILIKYNGVSPSFQRRPTWNVRKARWDEFKCLFPVHLETFSDIDDMENYIATTIIQSAERAIPLRKPERSRKEVPWWNNTIKILVKERRRLLKQFKRNVTQENLERYKQIKYELRKEIRRSRRESWLQFVESINLRTSSTDVFRKIKALNGSSNYNQINAIYDQDILITDRNQIADVMASNFENNSSSRNFSLKFRRYIARKDFKVNTVNNSEAYNEKFSLIELKSALRSCKGSSPGPDNIRYEMIKNLEEASLQYLLNFYNLIWTHQVFPRNWGKSLVIPILKPGKDSTDKNSYRPISLTNCLCKLLERMVNKRLVWYLEKNNILDVNQSGFRQNRCTVDNLVILHSDIMENFSYGKDVIAIFFDIRRAYDSMWRKLVFEKLNVSEIKGNMAAFISNFLKDRTFCCLIGNTYSNYFNLENGVPQGSVLSVTLFLHAINSVFMNITKGVKALLYADDLVIYSSGRKISTIFKRIQNTIKKLESWSDITGFQFHQEKTVGIKFSRRRKSGFPDDMRLTLYGEEITFVDRHKFLGVTFDEKLTFQHHIRNIKAKANAKLDIIKMLRCSKFGSDQQSLLRILTCVVLPTIDYASIIYSSASDYHLKDLNPILNTGIRLATGAFRTSPAVSLQVLAFCPPLDLRRLKQLLLYTLKILSLKDHPFNKMMANEHKIKKLTSKPKRYRPLYMNVHNEFSKILQKYYIDKSKIEITKVSDMAPWLLSNPSVNFELAFCKKNEMLPVEIQQRFREIINDKYKGYLIFYTDGSVMNEKSGFAFVGENLSTKRRLFNFSSIYTCELLAIRACVESISHKYTGRKIVIMSDSRSALEDISNPFSRNNIINQLRNLISKYTHNEINFMWIPSHVNLTGNELADRLAKEALMDAVDPTFHFQHNDFKRYIKKYIIDQWNDIWTNDNQTKLFKIQNHISQGYKQASLPRNDLIKFNRLRIGHCLLTHRYIIEKLPPPQCVCGQTLTIFHIFNQCLNYEDKRNRYKINDISVLANENNYKNIKQFLVDIDVYKSI
ncbi:uncharacterized protein LOC142239777 [Haematobia irritans]|uniref:uncharacterized protein LOC142239777 n=1 Tax=Haematobia irritans TaxID=7368 RepID=UPI003F5037DF